MTPGFCCSRASKGRGYPMGTHGWVIPGPSLGKENSPERKTTLQNYGGGLQFTGETHWESPHLHLT